MNKTAIEHDILKTKYNEFRSIKKTAMYFHCSVGKIFNLLKTHNIPTISLKGKILDSEHREKIIKTLKHGNTKGRKHSEKTKAIMSENRKGSKNANWKGGITKIIRKFRHSREYLVWRNSVIKKANGKCQKCGNISPLEAHHIISLHKDFSLALVEENGIALCKSCHIEEEGKR
jgi:5-methylcytosine-specific restriction endonuclease McrA